MPPLEPTFGPIFEPKVYRIATQNRFAKPKRSALFLSRLRTTEKHRPTSGVEEEKTVPFVITAAAGFLSLFPSVPPVLMRCRPVLSALFCMHCLGGEWRRGGCRKGLQVRRQTSTDKSISNIFKMLLFHVAPSTRYWADGATRRRNILMENNYL